MLVLSNTNMHAISSSSAGHITAVTLPTLSPNAKPPSLLLQPALPAAATASSTAVALPPSEGDVSHSSSWESLPTDTDIEVAAIPQADVDVAIKPSSSATTTAHQAGAQQDLAVVQLSPEQEAQLTEFVDEFVFLYKEVSTSSLYPGCAPNHDAHVDIRLVKHSVSCLAWVCDVTTHNDFRVKRLCYASRCLQVPNTG